MNLGNFFSAAPHARPINPKPVSFTAVSKESVLPGGARNPNYPGAFAARVTGCFVFVGGDGSEDARDDAHRHFLDRAKDDLEAKRTPVMEDPGTFDIEVQYQILQRALYEFDEKNKKVGARLFETVKLMRELVVLQECNRLYLAYNAYVKEEHPADADDATFREAGGGGAPVVGESKAHR